ncbi:MAG: wax ester/triacylglycerol synthase family O-acyltransferase [Pseudomonadota bacterium]
MKQLKPQDAQFLYMEDSRLAAHVTSFAICDQSTAPTQPVRFRDIVRTIEERLGDSPLFDRRLMRLPLDFDFPYWVEDSHFDIDYHVRHVRLPEPSDWRQLCIQVARAHSRPLDMNRPPWEIYVVEGLENVEGVPAGSFALIVKMHHSAVDGTSAMKFLFSMLDIGPKGPPIMPPPPKRKQERVKPPSVRQILTRAATNNLTSPAKLTAKSASFLPKVARAALDRVQGKSDVDLHVPKTRFNGEISPNRAFDATSFHFDELKEVRNGFPGATINDVVLGIVSGGLRRYLKSKKELPDEPLVITAPINTRSTKNTDDVKDDGNSVSTMSVPIFTNLVNPVERMNSIMRATESAKKAKSGLASRILTDTSQNIPAFLQANLAPVLAQLAPSQGPVTNAFVSNVPGVQIPLYFNGCEIVMFHGLAPIGAGMGLFIATPSYNNRISFGVTTTRQIMPDTDYFIRCLKKAMEELKEVANKRSGSVPGTKGRKRTRKAYIQVSKEPVSKKTAPARKKRKIAPEITAEANPTVVRKVAAERVSPEKAVSKTPNGSATAKPKPVRKKAVTPKPAKRATGPAQDLTLIKGIGPKLQEKLNAEGITRFEHLASLTKAGVAYLDDKLNGNGRITRDEWVKQAKQRAKAG